MAEGVRLEGRCASSGLARGRVHVLARAERGGERLSPEEEEAKLSGALESAAEQIEGIMADSDREAAEILEFQVELARDPSLAEDAVAAVRAGKGALEAWREAMDAQVAEYEAGDDEYFRARAADLADLRDRVALLISGGSEEPIPDGALVHADDLTASRFLSASWEGGGVFLARGSAASHVAMLARSRNVPMVVGTGWHPEVDGEECLLDASEGSVVSRPDDAAVAQFDGRMAAELERAKEAERHLRMPAKTAAGERVLTAVNVASAEDARYLDPSFADGIGLARTEFLFKGRLAGEEEQLASYQSLVKWADGRPVTIRTLDAGGDKPIPGFTVDGESNPFLGTRGLRLSLSRPEVFRVQVRAILRAAEEGPVKLMLPMVTLADELAKARDVIADEAKALGMQDLPPVGIMVEVPAAAMTVDAFDADFYSIGSNDLTQYVAAAGRDVAGLEGLAEGSLPAVLELVRRVAEHGRRTGSEVSLCGELAGDPEMTADLLGAGLRSLSMAPGRLGAVKAAIAKWGSAGAADDGV